MTEDDKALESLSICISLSELSSQILKFFQVRISIFTVLNVLKVCRTAEQTLRQQTQLKWNSVPISSSTAGDNSAEAAAATRRRRGESPGPEPPRSRSRDQCRCCLSSRDNCHCPVWSPFVISPSLPHKRELQIYIYLFGTNQYVLRIFHGSSGRWISSIVTLFSIS